MDVTRKALLGALLLLIGTHAFTLFTGGYNWVLAGVGLLIVSVITLVFAYQAGTGSRKQRLVILSTVVLVLVTGFALGVIALGGFLGNWVGGLIGLALAALGCWAAKARIQRKLGRSRPSRQHFNLLPARRSAASVALAVALATVGIGAVVAVSFSNGNPALATVTLNPLSGNSQTFDYIPTSGGDSLGAPADCPVRYDAYDAPAGSNNFGPTPDVTNEAEAIARWKNKVDCDPLYTATVAEYLDFGIHFDKVRAETNAGRMVHEPAYWRSAIEYIYSRVVHFARVNAGDVSYETLGMTPDPSGNRQIQPTLTKFSTLPHLGWTLVVVVKDLRTDDPDDVLARTFREWCDDQPAEARFVNVAPGPSTPVNPEKQGTGNGNPSSTPQTETPSTTSSSTTPGTTTAGTTTSGTTTSNTTTSNSTTTKVTTTKPETSTTTSSTTTSSSSTTSAPPSSSTTKPKDTPTQSYSHLPDAPDPTVTGPAATPTTPSQPAGTTPTGAPIPPDVTAPGATPTQAPTEPTGTPDPGQTGSPTAPASDDHDPDSVAAPLPAQQGPPPGAGAAAAAGPSPAPAPMEPAAPAPASPAPAAAAPEQEQAAPAPDPTPAPAPAPIVITGSSAVPAQAPQTQQQAPTAAPAPAATQQQKQETASQATVQADDIDPAAATHSTESGSGTTVMDIIGGTALGGAVICGVLLVRRRRPTEKVNPAHKA